MRKLVDIDNVTLEDRILRWIKRIRRDFPHSFGCNIPCKLISCDAAKQETVFRFHTVAEMSNPRSVTHGGMLALMMDWSMGITSRTVLDYNQTPTVDMQIQYLSPVPLDADLYVRTTIRKAGKSVAFLTAVAWTEDENNPLTMASGVYRLHEAGVQLD